jgi:3-hydroxybutyryl-CoA dehydrogenase
VSFPDLVGVVGGGRMGAGIAHAFLVAGAHVVIVERSEEWAASARDTVAQSVKLSVARNTVVEPASNVLERLSVATGVAALRTANLVIEAVPEYLEAKLEVLLGVERAIPESSWLATNTSSLSVTTLAGSLARPASFGGLHFFNPVPASSLVEIVMGDRTSASFEIAAQRWVAALNKSSITVRDSPGFASSRLGLSIALEAMRMLEEGVAAAADIDAAMVLGYRHPVGPLKTSDLVGLDVRLDIANHLHQTLGARFEPPRILRELVAAGNLGRKSGQGFFAYERPGGIK